MVSNVVDLLPNHTLLQVAGFLFRAHHNSTQQNKTMPSYTTFSITYYHAYFLFKNKNNRYTPNQ